MKGLTMLHGTNYHPHLTALGKQSACCTDGWKNASQLALQYTPSNAPPACPDKTSTPPLTLQRAADVMGHSLVIGFEPAHKTPRSRNSLAVAA
jgi:hypothetical protein